MEPTKFEPRLKLNFFYFGLKKHIILSKLKFKGYRCESGNKSIKKCNKCKYSISVIRIDQVEEDFLAEKMRIKKISDELNQTFDDMLNF